MPALGGRPVSCLSQKGILFLQRPASRPLLLPKLTAAVEIDPRFRPVVDAFANHRDVTGGKVMSSYGLKVKGKIFAMFGRKQFVAKLPKTRVDALVKDGAGKNFDPMDVL